MKTGLFFGSFNPIHNGHLVIANYMAEYTDLDKIWFVISPQNPLKEKSGLLADHHRYRLVDIAIENYKKFKVSTIEFKLPQPSYTIDTLTYLSEQYADKEFALIMGADNLRSIHKWKNYELLLDTYELYVYPRLDEKPNQLFSHKNVRLVDAPLMEISSSFIRKAVKDKKDVRFFMPPKVYDYMREMHFYEK